MRSAVRIRAVLALLALAAGIALAANDGPEIPRGKGDACVADTEDMRKNHMSYIKHQRDETVLKGIRDEPFSLVDCVDCHAQEDAQGQAIRVDADGQFCESCHQYVAVKIDCFGCHAAIPHEQGSTAIGQNETGAADSEDTLMAQLDSHLQDKTGRGSYHQLLNMLKHYDETRAITTD